MSDQKQQMQNQSVDPFPYQFLEKMIDVLDELPEEQAATILKRCSCIHYRELDMDAVLSDYSGRLPDFVQFLEESWGWKINWHKEEGIIEADENKSVCVCPLVEKGNIKHTRLCSCSEGFAERMFSAVYGKPVQAQVVRSVLRGDASCVYLIRLT